MHFASDNWAGAHPAIMAALAITRDPVRYGFSEVELDDPLRFDERFRRVWLTYLVGCAEMFRSPGGS